MKRIIAILLYILYVPFIFCQNLETDPKSNESKYIGTVKSGGKVTVSIKVNNKNACVTNSDGIVTDDVTWTVYANKSFLYGMYDIVTVDKDNQDIKCSANGTFVYTITGPTPDKIIKQDCAEKIRYYAVKKSAPATTTDFDGPWIRFYIDNEPPTKPQAVTINGAGGTYLDVYWGGSSDNADAIMDDNVVSQGLTSYKVCAGNVCTTLVYPGLSTACRINGLTKCTKYSVSVTATDKAGNETKSDAVTAYTNSGIKADDIKTDNNYNCNKNVIVEATNSITLKSPFWIKPRANYYGFYYINRNPCPGLLKSALYSEDYLEPVNEEIAEMPVSSDILVKENVIKEDSVQVYPNPANSVIYVNSLYNNQSLLIEIYNANGESVLIKNSNENNTPINVESFSAGIYLLKTTINDKIMIRKFIKQ